MKIAQSLREILECDYKSLALMRVLLSLVILGDLFIRSTDVFLHYTNYGIVPSHTMIDFSQDYGFSIHFFQGSVFYQKLIFFVFMFVVFGMLLGYKTRLSVFLSWFLLTSMQNRNVLLQNGGDDFLRLMVFWCNFLPVSKVFSVDSALKLHKSANQIIHPNFGNNPKKNHHNNHHHHLHNHNTTDRSSSSPSSSSSSSNSVISIATLCIKLQIAWLYWEGYYWKSGETWKNGLGLYYALKDEEFTTRIGLFLLHNLPISILKIMSNSTLIIELALPFLIFFPFNFTIYHHGDRFFPIHTDLQQCLFDPNMRLGGAPSILPQNLKQISFSFASHHSFIISHYKIT
jgi:hypothetical protein